jgi:hypothetical protein
MNISNHTQIKRVITPTSWIFTPIQSPEDQQHPVSGNREFGIKVQDGKMSFYTQGADNALGLYQSFVAHLQVTWNLPAFFSGSIEYNYMLKGKKLFLKVHNEYSISSGVTRNKFDDLERLKNNKCPLGNTDQYYIFSIQLP